MLCCEGMCTTYGIAELSTLAGDSFLGIDLAMSHSLEGRVGDTAPVCRLLSRRSPYTVNAFMDKLFSVNPYLS